MVNEVSTPVGEEREIPSLEGFRFQRFEVLNWGPFHRDIWKLDFKCHNTLLIGKNGSGKSTLVDAITTLFETPGNIIYNKAAGAKKSERSLETYILGHIRNKSEGSKERTEFRNTKDYGIILGVFYSERMQKTVTLAQFFSFAGGDKVVPIYIGALQDLSISVNFKNFGKRTSDLKRHLKNQGCTIFDNFAQYKQWYMRELNVSVGAMNLFKQCIALKDIADITSFVRTFMLEHNDVSPLVLDLITHFADLSNCYQQVLTARKQIEALSPLEEQNSQWLALNEQVAATDVALKQVHSFINDLQLKLVNNELERNSQQCIQLQAQLQDLNLQLQALDTERERLQQQHAQAGGDTLGAYKRELQLNEEKKGTRARALAQYGNKLVRLKLSPPQNEEQFLQQRAQLSASQAQYQQAVSQAQLDLAAATGQTHRLEEQAQELKEELDSLSLRDSNLPREQIELRDRMAQELNVDASCLPYAGELMQVKAEEKAQWEGAAERVLHGFALSLLVPDELYKDVVHYVNGRSLRGRLVFFKHADMLEGKTSTLVNNSLAMKIEIKEDSPFKDALRTQLLQRFNLACCTREDDFRRLPEAVMPSGLIKQRRRHEKDDRRDVSDRRFYVLGWSNRDKRLLLQSQYKAKQSELQQAKNAREQVQKGLEQSFIQCSTVDQILKDYPSFEELNVAAVEREIAHLQAAINELQEHNQDLKDLSAKLAQCKQQLQEKSASKESLSNQYAVAQAKVQRLQDKSEALQVLLAQEPLSQSVANYLLPIYRAQKIKVMVDDSGMAISRLERAVVAERDKLVKQRQDLEREIENRLKDFNHAYPDTTKEMVAKQEAVGEYLALLQDLRQDNLPKYEQRFKEKLAHSTVNDLAHLRATLNQYEQSISRRMDEINSSLREIDYNPESFIELKYTANKDVAIIDFKRDLQNCISNVFGHEGNLEAAEERFQLIKNLIDRLKVRSDHVLEDETWRAKVLDVRNWYTYAAAEYDRNTLQEREYYANSNAKSGGQKEKLAYTILAAALAYQFQQQEQKGGLFVSSLRFLMIDEAFGSGSPELATYGLKLFKQLQLQVLVVTPLAKINEIEPFISQVALAQGKLGIPSTLKNMTIEHFISLLEARNELRQELIRTLDEAGLNSATPQVEDKEPADEKPVKEAPVSPESSAQTATAPQAEDKSVQEEEIVAEAQEQSASSVATDATATDDNEEEDAIYVQEQQWERQQARRKLQQLAEQRAQSHIFKETPLSREIDRQVKLRAQEAQAEDKKDKEDQVLARLTDLLKAL